MSFIVYKSSAGSGKTSTIVMEYLSHCLPNPEKFQSIIAITFTNKATAEMKLRLIDTLTKLQNPKHHSDNKLKFIVDFIKKKTNLSNDDICRQSTKLLDNILHNYSNFAFSTIDSFVVKIVRSFAYELGLDNKFEIELDTETIIEYATAQLMRKIGEDELTTKLILKFAKDNFDDDKSFNVENAIKSQAKELFNSHQQNNINKLSETDLKDFLEIANELKYKIEKLESDLNSIGEKALNKFEENKIPKNAFYYGTRFYDYFKYLANKNYNKYIPNATVQKIINDNIWYSKSADENTIRIVEDNKEFFRQLYIEAMEIIENNKYEAYISQRLIIKNLYPLAVLSVLKAIIKDYSEENNIIHLSESNNKINHIVENEPTPFIYERIGAKYQSYLIDEFQDTSRIQWNNLIPLINNSLAEGNMNMIVGDAKQSIYRWRDGDLRQFIKLPEINSESPFNQERQKLFNKFYKEKNLNNNFRSNREIVDFNNKFFEYYKSQFAHNQYISKTYQNHNQTIKNNEQAYVQLNLIEKTKGEYQDINEISCEKILSIIKDIDKREFKLSDICIIARENKQLVKFADFLSEKGIDTISNEALTISKSNDIHFIISFLNWIYRKDDKISLLHISNYIIDKQNADNYNILKDIKEISAIIFLKKLLNKYCYKLDIESLYSMSVFDIVNAIINSFGIDANNNPYILQLLETIISDYKGDAANLGGFLSWWSENYKKIYLQTPAKINAVSLLSIHKSKGLEFPIVIFTPKSDKSKYKNTKLWINLESHDSMPSKLKTAIVDNTTNLQTSSFADVYEEEKRLNELDFINMTYVAFTRPEKELYVIVAEKDDAEFYNLFKNFISENELLTKEKEKVYSYGKALMKKKDEKEKTDEKENIISNYKFFNNDWRDITKLKINYKGNLGFDEENLLEKGKHIHTVLSKIYSINDVDNVIKKYRQLGTIDNSEMNFIEHKIYEMMNNELIKSFFDIENKVLNEQNILLPNSSEKIPDRIIQKKDKTIVVDYKLSEYKSINQILLQKYKNQIKEYSNTLTTMGFKNIKSYLVFLKGEINVLEVD